MKAPIREITIYVDPNDAHAQACAKDASKLLPNVRIVAYDDADLNEDQWRELLASQTMQPLFADADDNPQAHACPLAVKGKRAVLCQQPKDIYYLADLF